MQVNSDILESCFNKVADAIVNINNNCTAYWNNAYDTLTINNTENIPVHIIHELLFDNNYNYDIVAKKIGHKLNIL